MKIRYVLMQAAMLTFLPCNYAWGGEIPCTSMFMEGDSTDRLWKSNEFELYIGGARDGLGSGLIGTAAVIGVNTRLGKLVLDRAGWVMLKDSDTLSLLLRDQCKRDMDQSVIDSLIEIVLPDSLFDHLEQSEPPSPSAEDMVL